jgi:hypothetical protein
MSSRLSYGLVLLAGALSSCKSGTTAEPAAPASEAAPAVPIVDTAAAAPASAGAASCASPLLDALEDGDNRGAVLEQRGGYWYSFKDSNGTTLSPEGNFAPGDAGAKSSKHAAHISGKTGPSGVVYAGMGFNLADPMAPYDVSKATGICFQAKGPGSARVKLPDVNTAPEGKVCKTCYNDFGADFQLSPDWKEYCFKFADLKQQSGWGDPHPPALAKDKVFSLQWQVSANGADYDLWVDDIRLTCD